MKLENIEKKQVFSVPKTYFENLPTDIEARITRLESNIFTTPKGYFENLPAEIQARILPTAGKAEEVWEVPNDYFENLQHHILRRVNESKAKPLPMWGRQVFRLTTAGLAVLLGVAVWYSLPAGKEEIAQNLPKKEYKAKEKQPIEQPAKQEDKTVKVEETPKQIENKATTTQNQLAYLPTAVQPVAKKENLAQMLAKADDTTQEALSNLVDADQEDAAGNEDEEEWHEAHEETLHKITEEQVKALPKILKK